MSLRSIPLYMVMIFVLLTGWVHFNRVRAYLLLNQGMNEVNLLKAIEIDPLNHKHLDSLIFYYDKQYRKQPSDDNLNKLIFAIDLAIEKDPLEILNYEKMAGVYLRANKHDLIEKTFEEKMRHNIPGFYLAEIKASVFYFNAINRLNDPKIKKYFEEKAIYHYLTAIELNPNISRFTNYYAILSKDARDRFNKLMSEGKLVRIHQNDS